MKHTPSDNLGDYLGDPGYCTRAGSREARDNARSIAAIPGEQMPWPQVRAALIYRALAGFDTYAYRPANSPFYVIWDRQPDAAIDARFTPRAWALKHGFSVEGPEGGDAA